MTSGRITSLLLPVINVIFGVTTAAVLGLGAHYVETGAMEVGSLVANSQYISMVLMSVMMLALVIMMFPTAYACAGRMVLQDTWLFEGTIADNLGYAEENMDRNKIISSAKSACAHKFIKTLPGGYDMELSKGAENISQGERQLLTIARAIASDPEIMILDEATSNVDTHTEILIQRAMAQLMKGRTSFVIAHRLSTIRDADMILYMEDGDIKEVGNHDELMDKNGKYAALYNSQFA